MTLLLASRSPARAAMLRAAGVAHEAEAPGVDEAALKPALLAEGHGPRDIADALAEAKALKLSRRHPGRMVLGADQVLEQDGAMFDKPADLAAARDQLRALSGRTHQLFAAAVICEAGAPVWRHIGVAKLSVRPLSEGFIDQYLAEEGAAVLDCVGAYRAEGPGVQLFSRIEGDWFSILGLPLLPLLAYLRHRGVCPA